MEDEWKETIFHLIQKQIRNILIKTAHLPRDKQSDFVRRFPKTCVSCGYHCTSVLHKAQDRAIEPPHLNNMNYAWALSPQQVVICI